MIAKINASAVVGLDAVPIEVEVDIASQGLPSFTVVGLPDKAVEEAKERVRSALKNSGFDLPAKRITVNLAPADLPKEGASFDLPIAIGILFASGQIKKDITNALFLGELSLDGGVRKINGVLSFALLAKQKGMDELYVPFENGKEGALIDTINVYPTRTLRDLMLHITGEKPILPHPLVNIEDLSSESSDEFDMKDIVGQEQAKRALEIAAAGSHNILFKGPPGSGKTLLARTLPTILPDLTFDEAIEITKIYSISGLLDKDLLSKRPFRSPHHTSSHVGLIGGSTNPRPGEISLAHKGVLFLDELPEFPRYVLEALRQPLEDGVISISRSAARVSFPAKFMLVAAQNPCPCGFFGEKNKHCSCSSSQILRYQKRVSGPLLDRIDMHLYVPSVNIEKLHKGDKTTQESSLKIKNRVQNARKMQLARFKKANLSITSNSEMSSKNVREFANITGSAEEFLKTASVKMELSARSFYRILKLSRTIADLEACEQILPNHIAEALQYRPRLPTII